MDDLIKILDETTPLVKDSDLFAYEIPLDTSGAWVSESATDSRFNGTGYQEYDLYVRFKNKPTAISNLKALKSAIDGLKGSTGQCKLADGTSFSLEMTTAWSYMEKDAEGYFVWTATLGLIAYRPEQSSIDGGDSSGVHTDSIDGGSSTSVQENNIDGGNSNGN